MVKPKKGGLGKGLGALIAPGEVDGTPVSDTADPHDRILRLDPQSIEPNPKQPRKAFNEEALEELAESIKRDGMQEPVIVRNVDGVYQLVSGERRVRASIMAGCPTIPAVCREVSDTDMLKLGLIENIQREDLNPIELAHGYQALVDEFRWTQEQLAAEVGKKRVTVTNTLRLLNLPSDIQEYVVDGVLTMGHARALLALESQDAQRAAARKIVTLGLSVREAERLAAPKQPKKPKSPERKDANVAELEDELRRAFGAKVCIRTMKKNRGKIEIEYYSLNELDRILNVVRGRR